MRIRKHLSSIHSTVFRKNTGIYATKNGGEKETGMGQEIGDTHNVELKTGVCPMGNSSCEAPRTPNVSLPTRPKRTKPNPYLKNRRACMFIQDRDFQEQAKQEQVLRDALLSLSERLQDVGKHNTVEDFTPKEQAKDVQGLPGEVLPEKRQEQGLQDLRNDDPVNTLEDFTPEEKEVEEKESCGGLQENGTQLADEHNHGKRKRARRANRKATEGNEEEEEGNQCRRMDGKGWRCHRKTQPDYSLCDYHLDKFRETNQRKLKAALMNNQEPVKKKTRVKRKPVKARSLMSI